MRELTLALVALSLTMCFTYPASGKNKAKQRNVKSFCNCLKPCNEKTKEGIRILGTSMIELATPDERYWFNKCGEAEKQCGRLGLPSSQCYPDKNRCASGNFNRLGKEYELLLKKGERLVKEGTKCQNKCEQTRLPKTKPNCLQACECVQPKKIVKYCKKRCKGR